MFFATAEAGYIETVYPVLRYYCLEEKETETQSNAIANCDFHMSVLEHKKERKKGKSSLFSYMTDMEHNPCVLFFFCSMFALLSLHIFMHGCNLYMWRSTRINYNFIFEFCPSTALKYRDAFLVCTTVMTMVVGAMVIHLFLSSNGFLPSYIDAIPGLLFLVISTQFPMLLLLFSMCSNKLITAVCIWMSPKWKSVPHNGLYEEIRTVLPIIWFLFFGHFKLTAERKGHPYII